MTQIGRILSRIRLVPKRSGKLIKIVLLCAIVLSTAALLSLGIAIRAANAQADALRVQASRLEQENTALETLIDNLGTIEGIKQIARDQLGLEDGDSVIITPNN